MWPKLIPAWAGVTGTGPNRPEPGSRSRQEKTHRRIATLLALFMHLLLLAFLVIGINWQTRKPEPVQAELWIPPPPPAIEPRPEPVLQPAAKPVEPPKPAIEQPKVDIALERERKRREEEKKAQVQAREKLALEKARKDKERSDKERAEKEKIERTRAEKAANEQKLAKQKADQLKAEQLKTEQLKAEQAKAEQAREDYLKRLRDQASGARPAATSTTPGSGSPTGSNAGAGASGGSADADYVGRISTALRANTNFNLPIELAGNPKAIFTVLLAPDCTIQSVKLKRSSGLPAWDTAAERGISRTDPFPRPRTGACERELEIARGPKDDGPR
jgi:colicin import membrane protein